MKKVLILGGTKFVGLELIELLQNQKIDLYVASRKLISTKNFILIDRKSTNDLNMLFSKFDFDIVLDFICYSSLDSKKLIDSLNLFNRKPRLIIISSTYVYSNPMTISANNCFNENNFNPTSYKYSLDDYPKINYSSGKMEMESFFVKNYSFDKLVIIRFPVILGSNDYTMRTMFYANNIISKNKINPKNINMSSNYIFSREASLALQNFINSDHSGIYNISFDEISEKEMISIYCDFFNIKIDYLIDIGKELIKSPFFNNYNFIVDSTKYNSIFSNTFNFKESLIRELTKIYR
jgi:nucleoside-diphosphate-sugar epimerase